MEKDVGRMNSSVGWNANGYGDLDALELMQFFGGGGGDILQGQFSSIRRNSIFVFLHG